MKHQRAVVHDAALLQILGIAGEFFPFNADIVSAIDLSRHIERTQQLCNRLTEQTNIQIGCILCIENKCEVQIPQIMIYGTAAGGRNGLWTTDFTGALALVIGSEGDGMGRLVAESCDFIVSLPMKGQVSSLNASAAAAITMYEILRQRMG